MDIGYYKKFEPIFGEWRIVKEIGEGSYGKVFEIERTDFGYSYKAALKVISIPQSESELDCALGTGMDVDSTTTYFGGIVNELNEEFRLMSKLKGNSNVVSYEDHKVFRRSNGIGWDIFIRMELLTPLMRYSRQHPFGEYDVIRLGIDICKALELCRKHNIVHRDIKPENIFVSDDGQFKLGDFGIARSMEQTTGIVGKKGTYNYMAPEVYKGEAYGACVDIYSLGIMLYRYMNNGRLPFQPLPPTQLSPSDNERAIFRRVNGEKIPAPINAGEHLRRIILKACAYRPEDRYLSPSEMRADLEAILQGAVPIYAEMPAAGMVGAETLRSARSNPSQTGGKPVQTDGNAQRRRMTVSLWGNEYGGARVDAPAKSGAGMSAKVPAQQARTVATGKNTFEKRTPRVAAAPKKKKKDTKRLSAVIAASLLFIAMIGIFVFGDFGGFGYADEWSEWSTELPNGVTEDDYEIETVVRYRSRDRETTSSATETELPGWEKDDTAAGKAGQWSEWSETPITPDDTREVEEETRYRYRELKTTTGSNKEKSGWTLYDTTYESGGYGQWSDWSTSAPNSADGRDIETKTQYSYRTKSYTTSSSSSLTGWTQYDTEKSYGSWSSWGDSYISSSSSREVQTRSVVASTSYLMGHYCTGRDAGDDKYKTANWKFHDSCSYHTLGWFSSLDDFVEVDDRTYQYYGNGGTRYRCSNTCYNFYIMSTENEYKDQYRSRSIYTTYKFYRWDDWSSYSDSYVSGNSSREVRTRTLYRYRDAQKVPVYHFRQWGEWSDWDAKEVSPSDTLEVESAVFYRYRDVADKNTNYFYRWSEWSDWSEAEIAEDKNTDVEAVTFYRYRPK